MAALVSNKVTCYVYTVEMTHLVVWPLITAPVL
jgi:hypothetical protein